MENNTDLLNQIGQIEQKEGRSRGNSHFDPTATERSCSMMQPRTVLLGEELCGPDGCFTNVNPLAKRGTSTLREIDSPRIMIYIKPWDSEVYENFFRFVRSLQELEDKHNLIIECTVAKELYDEYEKSDELKKKHGVTKQLSTFISMTPECQRQINYIVTLGGDGTILWASKQFSGNYIPPLITFSQGSLGFMCNFVFEDHREVMDHVFVAVANKGQSAELGLDSRLRLRVNMGTGNNLRKVFRGDQLEKAVDFELQNFHVLNEIVVDRGPSPYSVQLDLYVDGNKLTSIVGDGIIISTPTGSTAYNMSAGGSIVQCNTDCICLTPLAPHSLSFRPLILPPSAQIELKKPQDGRSAAWVSLDGATRFKLEDGESILVQGSAHYLDMVTLKSDNLTDLWSQRLTKMFGWNIREMNKPLEKKKVDPKESSQGLYSFKAATRISVDASKMQL